MSDEAVPGYCEIVAALEEGDIQRALARIDRELDAGSDRRFALLLMRGQLGAALEENERAWADFTQALEVAESRAQRGRALLARGEAALQAGEVDLARDDLSQAVESLDEPQLRAAAELALGRLERDHGDLARGIALLHDARERLESAAADAEHRAEASLDLALALRAAGDVRQAIELLEALVEETDRPLRGRVLNQLGTNYGFAGRTAEALHAYARALTLLPEPDRAVVRYNRAVVFRELDERDRAREELTLALKENAGTDPRVEYDALLLSGIIAREIEDYQSSVEALRQAVDIAPDADAQGRARLEIGTTLAAAGLFGPAIDEFGAAAILCRDDADRARAHRYRGMARRELGLFEPALDDLDQAVSLTDDPDEQSRINIARAALLAALGRRREARDLAHRALDGVRDVSLRRQLLVQRGSLLSELGALDDATSDLERAAQLAESAGDRELLSSILADLGAIYMAVGSPAAARSAYERAAAIAVSGPIAHRSLMNLGHLLVSQGAVYDALNAFGRAVAAARDDRQARAEAFLARGDVALRLELYDQAATDFGRVLALRPAQRLIDRASIGQRTVEHHLEHIQRVREELTKAIAAADRPEYRAQPTLQRGMLALAAGDVDAAIVDVSRAINLFGLRDEKALAHAHLALVYAQLGRCQESLAAIRDADALDPERAWAAHVQGNWRWRRCRDVEGFPRELLEHPPEPDQPGSSVAVTPGSAQSL